MSDQLVRAISKDGFVKAVAVSTRDLTERARQIHHTLPVATAALGRTLAAASMMGNALKGDGASVTLQVKGGGQFIFDVNTPYKLRRMDGQMYMDETEESFCVWRTFFSERTQVCTYQVDLFRLNGDGTWDRDFEEHRERAWTQEQLRTYLTDAGFVNIRVSGDLTTRPPKPEEDRWIVRAEKPGNV